MVICKKSDRGTGLRSADQESSRFQIGYTCIFVPLMHIYSSCYFISIYISPLLVIIATVLLSSPLVFISVRYPLGGGDMFTCSHPWPSSTGDVAGVSGTGGEERV